MIIPHVGNDGNAASHYLLLGNFLQLRINGHTFEDKDFSAFAARLSDYAKLFMNVGRAEPPDGSFSSIRMNHHGIGSRCFCENLISGPECGIDAAAGGGLSTNAVDMNHCFKRSETGSVYTVFNEKIQQYKSEKNNENIHSFFLQRRRFVFC